MSYRIEPAHYKYISELPEISRAAAGLFPAEDLPIALRSEMLPLETLEEALLEERLWIVIDENEDKAVGFALLTERCGNIHLREIDVHPAHGRQGLGTDLLKQVITWSKNKKYQRFTLTTFRHLPWNAPFYAKLGFQAIDQSEFSPCLKKLLDEEAIVFDKSKRVLMILDLKP